MVDNFTKWVECVLLLSQITEVTAQAAINKFFARFGYPYEIFTEHGGNLENELFREICKLLGIHKARTTPYRPSGNGQVERCYVDDQPRSWDKYLSPLGGALRSAFNGNTEYTPNKLILGREVNIPATLMYKPPEFFQNRGK